MGKAAFTKAAVTRAVEAVKEGGVDVGTVEIAPDGTIRIISRIDSAAAGSQTATGPKRWAG